VSVRTGGWTVRSFAVRRISKRDSVFPALVGAKLPRGEIKKSKIRGEISEGMLCSETELGLGGCQRHPDPVGRCSLGKDLGEALGLKDTVLEISVTPNRPDCLCILGMAERLRR